MADSKITALTSISTSTDPANDPLVIVDVSDTSMAATGTTKKVTLNQLLGASGTATLASATITGDLTVATDRLKVVTGSTAIQTGATTQLQVGTTSWPSTVIGKSGSRSLFGNTGEVIIWNESAAAIGNYSTLFVAAKTGAGATTMGGLQIRAGIENASNMDGFVSLWTSNNTAGGFVERYKIDSTGVATWSNVGGVAGTAMTLNSTGLGVGTSPSYKLDVKGASTGNVGQIVGGASGKSLFLYSDNSGSGINNGSSGSYGTGLYFSNTSNFLAFYTDTGSGGTEKARIDSSGNVGIGVTPSAWTLKSLQIVAGGIYGSGNETGYYANAFYGSSGWRYINSAGASGYLQNAGSHQWYRSTSANVAGTDPVFSQAMTLDASGNLLVGTTNAAANSGSGFKVTQPVAGHFDALIVTSANSSTYSCWDIYSTGGTAGYRFYVTSTGTINAVNTTISAISDARLKENVQDIDVGLGAILALKPRKFDWKEGKGKNIKGDRGFIAQEFEQVFPQLVDEWKDAAPEGETPYKSVRQDLIPVLVKAIQELTARVQTLETR